MIEYHTWKYFKLISPYQFKFFPSLTHKLVGKGRLPSSKNKINETNNPCDDFLFKDFDLVNKNDRNEEINIILKGLNNSSKKIDKTLTTYIVNMNYDKFFYDFENVIQITSDQSVANGWIGLPGGRYDYNKSQNKVIFLIGNTLSINDIKDKSKSDILKLFNFKSNLKIKPKDINRLHISAMKHKVNISDHPMGSGMWAIIYLLNRYKMINIYGWDQYRQTPIQKLSLVDFVREIWSTIDAYLKSERTKEGIPSPKKFFCSILISYIYTFKILTNKVIKKRIVVNGYVSNISLITPIMTKLKKIIYN